MIYKMKVSEWFATQCAIGEVWVSPKNIEHVVLNVTKDHIFLTELKNVGF